MRRDWLTDAAVAVLVMCAVAILLAVALWVSGCAGQLDRAVVASNAAREIGDRAGLVLEAACTDRYSAARTPEDVAALDRGCLPARDALRAYSAAWLALVTAIQAAELGQPNEAELALLLRQMTAAATALSRAMGALEAR